MTGLSLKGLKKAGDILVPGGGNFPSFSQSSFLQHLPRMTNYMTKTDREGFTVLMTIFGILPVFMIRWILLVASKHSSFPDVIGAILRQINIGVKGVIMTLYYSDLDQEGEKIMQELNYKTGVYTQIPEDTEMENLLTTRNPLLANDTPEVVFQKARAQHADLRKLTVKERLTYITRLRKVILEKQEQIIDVIQKETAKARTDVLTSEIFPIMEHLEFLEHEAESALKDEKVATPLAMMGKTSKIWYEPMGTVLIISPWNYPFYQAIVPITCSFITGNASVYKPSELTPLKGLVESVLGEAGFRKDWAQVVYGDGKVAVELINQRPQKIFFTGSVGTGKKIMAQASQYLIPVELELGGKDPMLVFADANVERAARGALWGAFTNSGQSCTSVERLYVEESLYDNFRSTLLREAKTLTLGVDKDGNADMGAMISDRQVQIVADLVSDAVKNGAKMLTGADWDFKSKFIPPIILEGTTHDMRINQEEVFGPVLPLMKFRTEEEAIRLANDSQFGLSASVWTKDKDRALRVSRQIVTGNISINNVMLSEGNHALPFGGVKDSGIGRYKGVHGLRAFTNIKSVLVDSDSKKIEANWYPYTTRKYQLLSGLTHSLFWGGIKKWTGLILFGLPLESYSQKAKRE